MLIKNNQRRDSNSIDLGVFDNEYVILNSYHFLRVFHKNKFLASRFNIYSLSFCARHECAKENINSIKLKVLS